MTWRPVPVLAILANLPVRQMYDVKVTSSSGAASNATFIWGITTESESCFQDS
jgi:hypothetical protein